MQFLKACRSSALISPIIVEMKSACTRQARDFTNKRYRYKDRVNEVERRKNKSKSSIREKVEHAIGVIKRIFGFVKVRYRGLEKNANRLFTTCALANLYMLRHDLMRQRYDDRPHYWGKFGSPVPCNGQLPAIYPTENALTPTAARRDDGRDIPE